MREYVTVLHAHRSELSFTLGPRYSCPDRRGPIVNAAGNETAMLIHPRRTLTTTMTCGFQVCRDFTWILIEGVICLEGPSAVEDMSTGSIVVSCPGIRRREDAAALRSIDLGNRRTTEEKKGYECGEN